MDLFCDCRFSSRSLLRNSCNFSLRFQFVFHSLPYLIRLAFLLLLFYGFGGRFIEFGDSLRFSLRVLQKKGTRKKTNILLIWSIFCRVYLHLCRLFFFGFFACQMGISTNGTEKENWLNAIFAVHLVWMNKHFLDFYRWSSTFFFWNKIITKRQLNKFFRYSNFKNDIRIRLKQNGNPHFFCCCSNKLKSAWFWLFGLFI